MGTSSEPITVDQMVALYSKYREDLRVVREEQRKLRRGRPDMRCQLDDIEAELTYLMVREVRPARVVEIGALHGWSTSWTLRALRDNGSGRLYSFDLIDNARRNVPAELAGGRWEFFAGDVKQNRGRIAADTDYLFIDAAHSVRFARWYLAALLPQLRPGVRVSVHDVFHGRRAKPFSEGSVVLRWLAERGVRYLTASRNAAPAVYRRFTEVKQELGLAEPVRTSRHNPMIFFNLP